ncbi:hypothetical protein PIB30_061741 [Stylosanthes scabra]|uniref:Transposase MuDR plant domain-containing protein n=1 Tax=Stylosanthes scabra TaxID=79078 RepID=A0ABU6QLA7_9FABA|nr:hypothetical protein [Stylosanthes scabra]
MMLSNQEAEAVTDTEEEVEKQVEFVILTSLDLDMAYVVEKLVNMVYAQTHSNTRLICRILTWRLYRRDGCSSSDTQVSQGSNTPAEFQVGQSFHSKEEAVLAVKNYNIHRGVEYRVMESNHAKYLEKCKEFGKGCTWLIRLTLRKRKDLWEVRSSRNPPRFF